MINCSEHSIEYQIEKLHMCLLVIAKEVKRICETNDIQYFLIGGTLLGASRHGDIIPWDDDLDVGLLRNDYEKFIEICNEELSEQFILCTAESEEGYGLPYAKIRLKDTCFWEATSPDDICQGIFVDIFPIDKLPEGRVQQFVQRHMLNFLKVTLLYKCKYNLNFNKSHKLAVSIVRLLSLVHKSVIVRHLQNWQMRYNKSKASKYYVNQGSAYLYGREIFPLECLCAPLSKSMLRETEFTIPNMPETVLSLLYGDYMKLPPVEARVFCHVNSDIDFGPYEWLAGNKDVSVLNGSGCCRWASGEIVMVKSNVLKIGSGSLNLVEQTLNENLITQVSHTLNCFKVLKTADNESINLSINSSTCRFVRNK